MPGRDVLGPGETYDFPAITDSHCSPLAKRIFSVSGVQSCLFGPNFITITRLDEDEQWNVLKPELYAVITDFFNSNLPIINENVKLDADYDDDEDDDEVVYMIKELLDTRIRPTVMEDGGDIRYMGFDHDTGVLKLSLIGACASCPSSVITLKSGVENMMKFYVPEISTVEQIVSEEEATSTDVFNEVLKNNPDPTAT